MSSLYRRLPTLGRIVIIFIALAASLPAGHAQETPAEEQTAGPSPALERWLDSTADIDFQAVDWRSALSTLIWHDQALHIHPDELGRRLIARRQDEVFGRVDSLVEPQVQIRIAQGRLAVNQELTVYRGQTVVCQLRVAQADRNEATCDILPVDGAEPLSPEVDDVIYGASAPWTPDPSD